MEPYSVVVGTAGADSGGSAVAWAAAEAARRHRPLRIVHILEWNRDEAREAAGSTYVERVWSASAATTEAASRAARQVAPEVPIRTDTLVGQPATRLLDLAHRADLLVLGHRGRGGFAGIRLGSVTSRVAAHASCPVVVVRGRSPLDGPVVAGVDDSPAAGHVLEAAFESAAARAATLTVVRSLAPAHARRGAAAGQAHSWRAATAGPHPASAATADPAPSQRAATAGPAGDDAERLAEQLAAWRAKYPEVPVEVRLTHEVIAAALTGASAGAQLVVVGSHGHGVLRGALLGSTGLHLLHHAECPVLITRPVPGG